MTIERNDVLPIYRRVLDWARATGGWEAPVWRQLRAAIERAGLSQRLVIEAAAPSWPGCPRPGDRVLRLHIDGVLDLAMPEGIDEESPCWDGWRDEAIQSALDDGRWLECTAVADSEVGVLGDRGWLR
jgi:hypothetical protein